MTYFKRVFTLMAFMLFAAISVMAQSEVVKHTVEKGETLYGISKRYGVSENQILELNPGMRASSLKAGQIIIISQPTQAKAAPAAAAKPAATVAAAVSEAQKYVIKDGETLYSIAIANGMSTDELLYFNPTLNPTFYRGGDVITIPSSSDLTAFREQAKKNFAEGKMDVVVAEMPTPSPTKPAEPTKPTETTKPAEPQPAKGAEPAVTTPIVIEEDVTTVAEEPVIVHRDIPRDTYVAVILPFQKNVSKRTKSSAQANDFMRGFFVAVDTMKTNRRPVKLYVYDSANNTDSVKAILKRPELKKMQMIVAPNDSTHLALIDKFGQKHGIVVMNPFLGHNDAYKTSSTMMQATVPKDVFADKAVKGVVTNFPDRTPVILRRSGGPMKEKDFVTALTDQYREQGLEPVTITYNDKLKASDLEKLAARDGDYILIPYESSSKEAVNYLPAVVEFTSTLSSPSRVMLMGYPEWIVFGGDSRKNMEKSNTVIYSRFFVDNSRVEVKDAARQFDYWYHRQLESGFPRQGLLGIDLGMFIIKALRDNGGDFEYVSPSFDGIQGGYHFVKDPDNAGWYNDLMYLIQYRPSGLIEKIVL